MAVIPARQISSSNEPKERKQIFLVPNGPYVGMFASYSLPKEYKSYQTGEPEYRFYTRFLITHDAGNVQLPHFSEASLKINCVKEGDGPIEAKLFYDEESDVQSGYVVLMYALLGGRFDKLQIIDKAKNGGGFDLDHYIGRPVSLFIQRGKPDNQGLVSQRIKTIIPASESNALAVAPLFNDKRVEKADNGVEYLAYPSVTFAEDASGSAPMQDAPRSAIFDDEKAPF